MAVSIDKLFDKSVENFDEAVKTLRVYLLDRQFLNDESPVWTKAIGELQDSIRMSFKLKSLVKELDCEE